MSCEGQICGFKLMGSDPDPLKIKCIISPVFHSYEHFNLRSVDKKDFFENSPKNVTIKLEGWGRGRYSLNDRATKKNLFFAAYLRYRLSLLPFCTFSFMEVGIYFWLDK